MSHLTQLAKNLRTHATEAERILWRHLRGHRFANIKFRRQHPIENYIVDFVCFKLKLIIELDGSQHFASSYDRQRDLRLTNSGFKILRFWNNEIFENLEGILDRIYEEIYSVY
jgi:very-short-patch-repair endonuclease